MAFVLTLLPGGNAGVPITGNGEFLARVPIGHDDETHDVYSLVAALAPYPGAALGEFEFVFLLVRASDDDETEYWDGLETKRFCPDREDRKLIFRELCAMLRYLVGIAAPTRVVMTTHTDDLPDRALVKFQKLVALMKEAGFEGGRVDQWHGNRMWIAFR